MCLLKRLIFDAFCLFAGAGGTGFTPHVIMVKAGEVWVLLLLLEA